MKRLYLVCYDIGEPRRLARVHKKLKGYGDPVELSVFVCALSERRHVELRIVLKALINEREDRVLIVDLGPVDGTRSAGVEWLGLGPISIPRQGSVIV